MYQQEQAIVKLALEKSAYELLEQILTKKESHENGNEKRSFGNDKRGWGKNSK